MEAALPRLSLSNKRHETQLFMLGLTAPLRCKISVNPLHYLIIDLVSMVSMWEMQLW